MRILLVEDDPDQCPHVIQGLRQQRYAVDHACSGRDGLFLAVSEDYDLLIVDRILPQMDGLTLIAALRADGQHTPVIILIAIGQIDDRVLGLKAGGGDYIVKPFSFVELYARIEAVTRRITAGIEPSVLSVADLELDRVAHSARRAGKLIELKPQEYRLLEYLLRYTVLRRTES